MLIRLFAAVFVGLLISPGLSFAEKTKNLHVVVTHNGKVVQKADLPYVVGKAYKNIFNAACLSSATTGCVSSIGVDMRVLRDNAVRLDVCHSKYLGASIYHGDGIELLLPNVLTRCSKPVVSFSRNKKTGLHEAVFVDRNWTVTAALLENKTVERSKK